MKAKNKILLSGIAILSTVGTGHSAQAEGFYISGNVSSATLGHTIERNTGAALGAPNPSGVTNVEETDLSAGVALGYTHDLPGNFFVGAEGFYNLENSETRNINGVLATDVELNSTYGARLLAGAHVTDKLSLYAHGGATVLDYDVNNSYTFAPPVMSRSDTEVGFSYGVGAEYKVASNVSVFSEYTQITDVSFSGIPEVAGGTGRVNPNDLDLSKLTLGVKYAF